MLRNFILEQATNPGTASAMSLAGAVTGRFSFASRFSNGDLVYYVIDDGTLKEWGVGTLQTGSPNVLQRTTVVGNSAGTTARMNFLGTVQVYCDLPAEKTPCFDHNGHVDAKNGGIYNLAAAFNANDAVNKTQLDAVAFKALPVGAVLDYAGVAVPAGYLWCAGQNVSRTTYAALFAALSTTYGAGDGSTTFTLPDLRGRLTVGRDDQGGTAANRVTAAGSGIAGTTRGAMGGDERVPAHSHGVTDPGHGHGVTDPGHAHTAPNSYNGWNGSNNDGSAGTAATRGNATTTGSGTGISINGNTTGLSVNSAGLGTGQNMPPVLVLDKIIFAGV